MTMSKVTRPKTEGSVTCGFYNSISDSIRRKYDSEQMSAIFDGVIADGVFATIGNAFYVRPSSGNTVTIDTGKAWLNHTWTQNDALLPITLPDATTILNRYDAIVLEVNASNDVKDNCFQIISGTAASSPSKPELTNNALVHQHPICYIYRPADSTEILPDHIEYVVGSTAGIPWVTGLIDTVDPKDFLDQWKAVLDTFVASKKNELDEFVASKKNELDEFVASEEADIDAFMTEQENDFNTWYAEMKQLMGDVVTELDTWTTNQKNMFTDWFEDIKGQLSTDAAGSLQVQIDKEEVERILIVGMGSGDKTFSDDGTIITMVDSVSGRTLTKTFTNDFLTCTTVLTDSNGGELGRLVKSFGTDGKTVSSELTIL